MLDKKFSYEVASFVFVGSHVRTIICNHFIQESLDGMPFQLAFRGEMMKHANS